MKYTPVLPSASAAHDKAILSDMSKASASTSVPPQDEICGKKIDAKTFLTSL